jgi:hypothetical protein
MSNTYTNIGEVQDKFDGTFLKDADIGVTVQGYDADIPTVAASQAEMEAGTETANRTMNPAGVKQAIVALGSGAILAEYVVTGSAVTSIDFTGLDINTHKNYRIVVNLINADAGDRDIFCYVNGDTTNTNYYSQEFVANSTSISGSRANAPYLSTMIASDRSTGESLVVLSDSLAFIKHDGSYSSGSGIQRRSRVIGKTTTDTNITQLTFTASSASAIAVGSKIQIYRGDV